MNFIRYIVLAFTFLLTTLLYVDRIAISIAKNQITTELAMTDTQFGWALSAFALGYAIFQAPAGAIADRYGPRIVLATIVILWSLFTGLTGLAWGVGSLVLIRFLFGAAEAGAFPCCARVVYLWFPAAERALAQGINLSGTRVGAAFALPMLAWLVDSAGWRSTFFVLGAVGVIWAAGWQVWFRNSPEEHAWVSEKEKAHIVSRRGAAPINAQPPASTVLWHSWNLRLAMGQYFVSCFIFFFCLTWLFPHLQRTYGLSTVETGFLAAVPLLGGACGNWVGGGLVDVLHRRGYVSKCYSVVAILGFLLAVVGLAGSLTAEDAPSAVAWLTLAIFGADMTLPPSWAFCIAIGGPHSGVVSGMMNMAGNIGAFVTALAFPYMLATFGSTDPFFVTGMLLSLIAAYIWTLVRPEKLLDSAK